MHSEAAVGPVQRHWLAGRNRDDCPRCGWHGYFHHYLATVDGDWAAAICDDCYADLHPGITVTVTFFSARFGRSEPFAVIRQRTRSDHDYPDIGHFPDTGQQMTWRLRREHTAMLTRTLSARRRTSDAISAEAIAGSAGSARARPNPVQTTPQARRPPRRGTVSRTA